MAAVSAGLGLRYGTILLVELQHMALEILDNVLAVQVELGPNNVFLYLVMYLLSLWMMMVLSFEIVV